MRRPRKNASKRRQRLNRRKPRFFREPPSLFRPAPSAASALEQLHMIRAHPSQFVKKELQLPTRVRIRPKGRGMILPTSILHMEIVEREHDQKARLVGALINHLSLEEKIKTELGITEIRRLLLQKMLAHKELRHSFSGQSLHLIVQRIKELLPTVREILNHHPNQAYRNRAFELFELAEPFIEQFSQRQPATVSLQNDGFDSLYDTGVIVFSEHRKWLLKDPVLAQEFEHAKNEIEQAYLMLAVPNS